MVGLLPQLIDSFFKQRDKYEAEYAKAIKKGDEVAVKSWWRRIFNLKQITNAIYGVMDFDGFRLSKQECSAAVALIGRESIRCLNDVAKELGYELIYGDTDSIFVLLKGIYGFEQESLLKEAQELQSKLNSGLSKYFKEKHRIIRIPSEIGLRRIYCRFLLIAKKYYAGKYVYDEIKSWKEDFDFKGLEIIRSDSSDLEKYVLEHIIKIVLDGEGKLKIKEFWDRVVLDFKAKKYTPLELAYPLQIKESFRNYIFKKKRKEKYVVPAHIRSALYSNKYLNTDFEQGDKPRRLPIYVKMLTEDKKQTTLFNSDLLYPTIWEYESNVDLTLQWKLRNISIAEDMVIPQWFIKQIDYIRIFTRLKNKVDKILNLVSDVTWVKNGVI